MSDLRKLGELVTAAYRPAIIHSAALYGVSEDEVDAWLAGGPKPEGLRDYDGV